MAEETKCLDNIFGLLNDHIIHLLKVIDPKTSLVEELVAELRNRKESRQVSPSITQETMWNNKPREPFRTVGRIRNNKRRIVTPGVSHIQESRYQPLYHSSVEEDCSEAENNSDYKDDSNSKTSIGMKACKQTKRPPNVINGNPEHERCFNKTVAGNSSYAEISREGRKTCIISREGRKTCIISREGRKTCIISREGRKTCIIGAPLIKRIDMQEFNRYLEKGTAIKKSFPGATASRVKYYIEEVLKILIELL